MKLNNLSAIKPFLLDNTSVRQTIFKNTFWLGGGLMVDRLLKLFLLIYAARILGATEYGKFTFALAFISLFITFADLGLSSIITREFSREEKKDEFYSLISLKFLLTIGTFILILISSFFVAPEENVQKAILILAVFSLVNSFATLFYAFFQARQRMEYQTWSEISQAFLLTLFGLFILFKIPSVENLSYVYLFVSLIMFTLVLLFFHFKIFYLNIRWQKEVWQKFLKMSWPLALTGLFGVLYTYIDSVMMGYFGQITQTGWYNASYKIIMVCLIPMGLLSSSFYPVLSKFFKDSKERLQNAWNHQLQAMILLALPLVVGGIIFAPRIINSIYGAEFYPSIFALQILIVMAGIIFIYRPFYDVLIVSNQQKKIFWVSFAGVLINIILNLILIPKYSLYGAAIATVITYLSLFFLIYKFTLRFTMIKPFNLRILVLAIGAVISTAFMYFIVRQPFIYNLKLFFSIPIGALIYFASLFILKKLAGSIYEKI